MGMVAVYGRDLGRDMIYSLAAFDSPSDRVQITEIPEYPFDIKPIQALVVVLMPEQYPDTCPVIK